MSKAKRVVYNILRILHHSHLIINSMSPAVVTKYCRSLVSPRGNTPSGNLPLSRLDKVPALRRLEVELLLVFRHGIQPAIVIREALSKALNHYYPLAGRLVQLDDGDLEVACTGEGAWFVEALADCSLQDVNFLDVPLTMITTKDILPLPRPGIDPEDSLLMIQVTEFTCGGFSVGYLMNHVLFDGIGCGQFLKAMGEMARNLDDPTVPPIWSRESIPGPPSSLVQLPPLFRNNISTKCQYSTIDVSLVIINKLKNRYMRGKNVGRSCTTFQILSAMLWQCWAQVIGPDLRRLVEIAFAVNIRPLLHKEGVLSTPTGGGYYGNCVVSTHAKAPNGMIAKTSIEKVVDLIRDAQERVPEKLRCWARREQNPQPSNIGDMLLVGDWRGVGHLEADFGWGLAARWGPLMSNVTVVSGSCIIVDLPSPLKGVRMYTAAATKDKLAQFLDQIKCELSRQHIVPAL